MEKSIKDLIKVSDFKDLKHYLYLRNDTSSTGILDCEVPKIEEFLSDGIVVSLPVNSCKQGHLLTLFIVESAGKRLQRLPQNGSVKGAFEVIAKVIKIVSQVEVLEKEEIKIDHCRLQFSQFDEYRWGKIVLQYKERQQMIDELIKNRHGGESV